MTALRLGAQFALFTAVALGAFGMRDSHQAKLPLSVIGGLLGWAYFSRQEPKQ